MSKAVLVMEMPGRKTENYRSEFARGIKKGWNDAIKVIDSE